MKQLDKGLGMMTKTCPGLINACQVTFCRLGNFSCFFMLSADFFKELKITFLKYHQSFDLILCLVLVQPRKAGNHLDITETLLTGM